MWGRLELGSIGDEGALVRAYRSEVIDGAGGGGGGEGG